MRDPTWTRSRVVLVDDQTIFRELLSELLLADGHRIEAQFSSVEDAVAGWPQTPIELVVLDVVLPDGSGLDLLARLGAPLRRTRVLLLTASERPEVVRRALELGVEGIVMKGAPLSELREAVRRIESGSTYFCAATQGLLREAARRPPATTLTPREQQVALLIARGLTSKEIAANLGVSLKTVTNHRVNLMAKLGLRKAADVTRYVIQSGMLSPDRSS
jgi:DNA-binding NarL/FixJ family response regulator